MVRAQSHRRQRPEAFAGAAWICAAALTIAGCAGHLGGSAAEPGRPAAKPEPRETDLITPQPANGDSRLQREVARLHEELREAEASMRRIESGERSGHADAVSALAEGRIAVERASQAAPWRVESLEEARRKLEGAERELHRNHRGTAIFLASSARRIANTLDEEGHLVAQAPDARFIRNSRVNLRAGPSTDHAILGVLQPKTPVFEKRPEGEWVLVRTLSGQLGWVYGGLLR
jgi:hypothetical protein